ncbi:MAG TPA: hypothetical protein VG028_15890 [Terriglobia bacterium]|nr:hypothetical protein [Terriglobia bacterium]
MANHKFVEVLNKAVLLNVEQGNEQRVIIGGNDGTLITIDANGRIHVTPPEGPGDPEVRQAVASILQGVNVLGRLGAAGASGAGASA